MRAMNLPDRDIHTTFLPSSAQRLRRSGLTLTWP
jgi:hypothetical protein